MPVIFWRLRDSLCHLFCMVHEFIYIRPLLLSLREIINYRQLHIYANFRTFIKQGIFM